MLKQQIIGILSALLILGVVLNLVRRRRLREEYSWLWLFASVFYLILSIEPIWVTAIGNLLGIQNTVTFLLFMALIFIVLILINYSVNLSKLNNQMKDIAQHIALLGGEHNNLNISLKPTDEKQSENCEALDSD